MKVKVFRGDANEVLWENSLNEWLKKNSNDIIIEFVTQSVEGGSESYASITTVIVWY